MDEQTVQTRALELLERSFKEFLAQEMPPMDKKAEYAAIYRTLVAATQNPNQLDHDVLISTAATLLRQGTPMGPEIAHYVADFLDGKRQRPTQKGPKPFGQHLRDLWLAGAARALAKEFSLPLYTNNELATIKTAAEIVSAASAQSASFRWVSTDVVIKAIGKFPELGEE